MVFIAAAKVLPLKETVDEALNKSPTVEKCLVLRRVGQEGVPMTEGRDVWWHDIVDKQRDDLPAVPLDSETTLFILYTSGSTGKPKGIRHTTAGYNLWAKRTFQWVFDHRDDDIYWCTADCGWITGHSYVVYGPLSAGATCLMYEGAPNHPAEDRFWELVEKYKVTVLYTAPTAIRTFIKWGDEHVDKHDLVEPSPARQRWRRDQPGSLDVVPPKNRQRALSDRRYMVANRDGGHHDEPVARDHGDQTWFLHASAAGRGPQDRR